MLRTIRLSAALASLGLLAACAGAPEPVPYAAAACPADWRAAGEADAEAGRPAAPGLDHLAECLAPASSEQLEAEEDAYLAGHDLGRAAWCGPSNAYDLGLRGAPRTLSCPPPLDEAFETAYARGLEDRRRTPWLFRLRPLLSVGVGTSGSSVSGGVGVVF